MNESLDARPARASLLIGGGLVVAAVLFPSAAWAGCPTGMRGGIAFEALASLLLGAIACLTLGAGVLGVVEMLWRLRAR